MELFLKKSFIPELISYFLLFFALSCDEGFPPAYLLEKLKILGVRIDNPEVCVFGEKGCPKDSYKDKIKFSLLAADNKKIIADGNFPGGAFFDKGYEIKWALCRYSLRGLNNEEPDCTLDPKNILPGKSEILAIPATDIFSLFSALFDATAALGNSGTDANPVTDFSGFGQDSVEEVIALSMKKGEEYLFGTKKLTISRKEATLQNRNPELTDITINKLSLKYSDKPSIELQTGYSYRIEWKFPDKSVEEYEVESFNGKKKTKERFDIVFYASAGNFSKDGQIQIWMENEKENQLYWRSPLEVPKNGMEVVFVFKLNDGRGGCDWKWGKAKVVRGDGVLPRY